MSFNASVEAARAGEHGKGFAVVAEEVGKLAQMSGNIATEINQIVTATVAEAQVIMTNTVSKVEKLSDDVKKQSEIGLERSKECEHIFSNLNLKIKGINDNISEIARATKEQNDGINSLDSAVINLQEAAERIRLMAGQSNENAQAFDGQVHQLGKVSSGMGEVLSISNRKKLMSFVWSNKYRIGVEQMDEEHQILVGKVNELVKALEANRINKDLNSVLNAFNDMANYTIEHFSDEEKFMEKINYPQLNSHKNIHKNLIEQVLVFKKQIEMDRLEDERLISFLRNWLISHIMGIDAKYAKHFLEEKRASY